MVGWQAVADGDLGGSFLTDDERAATVSRRRHRIVIGGASLVLAAMAGACVATSNDGDGGDLDTAESTTTLAPTTTTQAPTTTLAPTTTTHAPTTTLAPTATTQAPTTSTLSDECAEPLGKRVAPTIPLGEADIDGDGDGEELFTDDERREVWVRTAPDRFSAPTTLDVSWATELLDAVDLDGDGGEELFVNVGGNTAELGVLLDWDDDACALRAVEDPDPDDAGAWLYLHYASGFSCFPTGCWVSIVCAANDGIVEIVASEAGPTNDSRARFFANPDLLPTPEDLEVWWYSERFRFDGELESLGYEHGTGPLADGLPVPGVRGVACSNWLRGGEGCAVSPTVLDTPAGWEFEGRDYQHSVIRQPPGDPADVSITRWISDAGVVELQNPGSVVTGDPMAEMMIGDRPATLVSDGTNSRMGPWFVLWNTSEEAPVVDCETWALVSDDLDAGALAAFARDLLRATVARPIHTNSNCGTPFSYPGFVPSAGRHLAVVKAFDEGTRELHFDVGEWRSGDEDEFEWEVANVGPTDVSVPLSSTVSIWLVNVRYADIAPASFGDLASFLASLPTGTAGCFGSSSRTGRSPTSASSTRPDREVRRNPTASAVARGCAGFEVSPRGGSFACARGRRSVRVPGPAGSWAPQRCRVGPGALDEVDQIGGDLGRVDLAGDAAGESYAADGGELGGCGPRHGLEQAAHPQPCQLGGAACHLNGLGEGDLPVAQHRQQPGLLHASLGED